MTHRCVLLASALLLLSVSSSRSQDADKKKELERRYQELLGKAAALHVDLGRWLEKEGQLAWAKYQYEWALEVVPGHADATAALAKEGVKWENKHTRFEQLDKGLVTCVVNEVIHRPDEKIVDCGVRFYSKIDGVAYLTFAIRKKSNAFSWGYRNIIEVRKEAGLQATCWEEIAPDAYQEFKAADPKQLEIVITSFFKEDAVFARQKGDLLKRFKDRAKPIGVSLSKFAADAEAATLNDLVREAFTQAIVYDRDNEVARKSLGFEKTTDDFAWIYNREEGVSSHVQSPGRWLLPGERELKRTLLEMAKKESPGELREHEGKPARFNGIYTVYPVGSVTISDVEDTVRLLNAWRTFFNKKVGSKKDIFGVTWQGPYSLSVEKKGGKVKADLLLHEARATMIRSFASIGFMNFFGVEKNVIRGAWAPTGIILVLVKLLEGYCDVVLYDKGTAGVEGFPGDRNLTEVSSWHDPVRDAVTCNDGYAAEQIVGKPVNLLDEKGLLQLWSFFHFVLLTEQEKLWDFVKQHAINQDDRSGAAQFWKVMSLEPTEFVRRWRRFVLTNY